MPEALKILKIMLGKTAGDPEEWADGVFSNNGIFVFNVV